MMNVLNSTNYFKSPNRYGEVSFEQYSDEFSSISMLTKLLPKVALNTSILKDYFILCATDKILSNFPNSNTSFSNVYNWSHDISTGTTSRTIANGRNDRIRQDMLCSTNENLYELIMNNAKLDEISQLEYDWNMYGAEPIPKELVRLVKEIIQELTIQPEIFPTGRKTIQLQAKKDGEYIEFEIFNSKRIEGLYVDRDGNYTELMLDSEEMITHYNECFQKTI